MTGTWSRPALAFLFLFVSVQGTCVYNGKSYEPGETFMATDGCNQCQCLENGAAGCTRMSCPKPARTVAMCEHEGAMYKVNETFMDDCNQCRCSETGDAVCTRRACLPPSDEEATRQTTCLYNGQTYHVGETFKDDCNDCHCMDIGEARCTRKTCVPADESALESLVCVYSEQSYTAGQVFPATDGCNTCQCLSNGAVGCTRRACPMGTRDSILCEYNGKIYNVGDRFMSSDGCNHCFCTSVGQVACTKKACITREEETHLEERQEVMQSGCTYLGKRLEIGEHFMSDACNTCHCKDSNNLACTKKACIEGHCQHEGTGYMQGQIFLRTNGDQCEFCECQGSGEVTCEEDQCPSGKSNMVEPQGKEALLEEAANCHWHVFPSSLVVLLTIILLYL